MAPTMSRHVVRRDVSPAPWQDLNTTFYLNTHLLPKHWWAHGGREKGGGPARPRHGAGERPRRTTRRDTAGATATPRQPGGRAPNQNQPGRPGRKPGPCAHQLTPRPTRPAPIKHATTRPPGRNRGTHHAPPRRTAGPPTGPAAGPHQTTAPTPTTPLPSYPTLLPYALAHISCFLLIHIQLLLLSAASATDLTTFL